MNNINPSKHIQNDQILINKQIKNEFINLDFTRKNKLIKQLSSNERIYLLKIIENNGNVHLKNENQNRLIEKIRNAHNLTINITRKDDTRSMISSLKQTAKAMAANIAYVFNFLTASKANELIKAALLKQETKLKDKPEISSQELAKLITKARKTRPAEQVILAQILESQNYSKEISGQTFSSDFSLKDMDLQGITFINCRFDWISCSNSNLREVTFKSCNIYNLSLMNSTLEDCIFDNCEMREVMFTGAMLNNVNFRKSSLISNSFEDSSLRGCVFQNASLPGTHFLEASIAKSCLFDCNLTNTIFFETVDRFEINESSKETAKVTRPTTAILVHPEVRGITTPKAYMKLDQVSGTIPLRITMQTQKTTKTGVNAEIESILKEIGPYDRKEAPIPQRLIEKIAEKPDFECFKILRKAEKLASQVNSIFLPGGEDIPPALYGQQEEERTNWGDDYRRSVLELGLIHQSFTKGVPLMAVCRGFQMSNVYFGAQLIQHIDGHKGLQMLELSTPEKRGLYAAAMKNNIMGAVFHHQAILEENSISEHLEIAVRYQGIVKATELNKSGTTPMILLQFHPEFYKAETADSMTRELVDRGLIPNVKIKISN